jgi:hypothetical protein
VTAESYRSLAALVERTYTQLRPLLEHGQLARLADSRNRLREALREAKRLRNATAHNPALYRLEDRSLLAAYQAAEKLFLIVSSVEGESYQLLLSSPDALPYVLAAERSGDRSRQVVDVYYKAVRGALRRIDGSFQLLLASLNTAACSQAFVLEKCLWILLYGTHAPPSSAHARSFVVPIELPGVPA